MNTARKLSETFCLLVAAGFVVAALPVNAEVTETVKETTVTQSNDATGSTTTTTTTIKAATVKPDVYIVTIDTRRRELEKIIGEGMATGKLTKAQADELRSDLDDVTKLEIAAQKLGAAIPYTQIAVIATRLDVIALRLTEIVGVQIAPIMSNGRITIVSGEIVELDEMASRRAEMEGKISIAYAHHTLTKSQVKTLRLQLDDIAATEVKFRNGDINGQFTDEQARTLFKAFDHVGSQIDSMIASNKGKPVTGVY